MTRKDKLYIAGSTLCLIGVGLVIFSIARDDKAGNASQAVAGESSSAPIAAEPAVAGQDTSRPDNVDSAADTNISDPTADQRPDENYNGNNAPSDGPNSNHQREPGQNLPAGSKPFFGSVSAVSGSQITLSSRNNSTTTITISGNTEFDGGTKDQIISGARIAGYGTANSDGSIVATKITINPAMPGGGKFNRNSGS